MASVSQQALLGGGEPGPATLAFQGFTTHTNEAQTVTFTAVPIGAAAGDRYVFITIPYYNLGATNVSISSVTIGGVLAKIHAQPFNASTIRGGCALVSALVPSGTTANVVITWAASGTYRPRIGVYRVTGLQSDTAVDLDTDTATSVSMPRARTINVTKSGFALLGSYAYGNSNSDTLAGLTQDFMVSPLNSMVYIGGSGLITTSGTLTATISGGTSANMCSILASFR